MRAALGIDGRSSADADRADAARSCKAPVDLLYNGGIGTYVKADAARPTREVGDRANDAIRVNGAELRCKVVAEGGNLGCTQLGRIEFALAGGRINTDAIDNSAGVDMLRPRGQHQDPARPAVVADGELTDKQRNTLLAEMTDDVGALVLRDNYYQTQVLSVTRPRRAAAARRAGALHAASSRRPGGSTARSSSCRPTRRSPSAAPRGWA